MPSFVRSASSRDIINTCASNVRTVDPGTIETRIANGARKEKK